MLKTTLEWLARFDPGDLVATLALAVAFISIIYTRRAERRTRRRELRLYNKTQARELRVEKSTAYLSLEVNSSAVFQYAAEKADVMDCFRCLDRPAKMPEGEAYEKGCEITRNLYFQSLNLFEVCARFRRQEIIEPEVFASWVAWFYELQDDWFFREEWPTELRANYTDDVRAIFDIGCEIFADDTVDRKEDAFYAAVADIMDCNEIRKWPSKLNHKRTWDSLPSYQAFQSSGTSLPTQPPTPQPLPAA